MSFRVFSIGALIVCVCHIFLRPSSVHETMKSAQKNGVEYSLPLEQRKVELES